MAGGYNQLGYAKYYRVWDSGAPGAQAAPAPTTEGYEVSLLFIPTTLYDPAGAAAVFNILGYQFTAADQCVPNLATEAVVQIPSSCDDPAGTPALAPAVVRVGGVVAADVTPVAPRVGCEVSFPCMDPFLRVAAVSGQTGAFDVVLRIGRLKRARF